MSITHFEDLPLSELVASLYSEWNVVEKVDGSFLEFGLEEDGRFFSNRKGGQRCYSIDEWPDEGWSPDFRAGHSAASMVVSVLAEHGMILPGESATAELVPCSQPNTISYSIEYPTLVITKWPNQRSEIHGRELLNDLKIGFKQPYRISNDEGQTLDCSLRHIHYRIGTLNSFRMYQNTIHNRERFRESLIDWLGSKSSIFGLTIRQLLDLKFNQKRPDDFTEFQWKKFKPEMKRARERYRHTLSEMIVAYKNVLMSDLIYCRSSQIGLGLIIEGVVIRTETGSTFKVVDRIGFSKANLYSHIIKYWLVGGRRPTRPSFLSRTSLWPKEKRLARLEVLRKRFLKHGDDLIWLLSISGSWVTISYSSSPLKQRVFNLFADVKQRIENGR